MLSSTFNRLLSASLVSLLLVVWVGCARETNDARTRPNAVRPVSSEYPDGDPSIPASQGGPGFDLADGDTWTTNVSFDPEGDPAAEKGGAIRYWQRFPPTVRIIGKDSSTAATAIIRDLCYESLLTLHGDTQELLPRLATHWHISDDGRSFRFRINPRAHWSDGQPVIADDVTATWDLLMDTKILQPAQQVIFSNFERPHVVSKYIVEVRSRDDAWNNFNTFATMPVLPAHIIGELDGSQYLNMSQFHAIVGSGPYELGDSDIRRGRSLTFRRREDYWGWGEPFAVGLYNFDIIRLVSTEDSVLGLEKTKKGEIDVYRVGKAKDWAVDLPRLDQVQRGLLAMTQIDNDEPVGASGIVINMRVPPLDDVRIRKALCHLYHRELLIEKLFHNAYSPLDSYFPDTPYANPDNERIRYDPQRAADLLADAGWRERDAFGYLVKNDQRLSFELLYSSKVVERYLSVFQDDCRKAGIEVRLQQLTRASRFQLTYGSRRFQLATDGWGGDVNPQPGNVWRSDLADKRNNPTLAGFKNQHVDELCRQLETITDGDQRQAILREIDGLIFAEHPCVLGWYSGYVRLAYWNKFGHPPKYLGRSSGADSILRTWWIDEAKAAGLKEAKRDGSITLDTGPREVRY